MCANTFMFLCVCVCFCVCVHVCICAFKLYKSKHVQLRKVRVYEPGLVSGDIPYFIPSAVANAVLLQPSSLSSYIPPCSLPCVLPGERILVVCKSHFPYPNTSSENHN